jgi:hypothetical protein
MTLHFHLYQDGFEVEPAPISREELERYKKDSQRCLADRKQRIADAIHRTYETMRAAKPQQLIHLFLAVSIIGLHCIYA